MNRIFGTGLLLLLLVEGDILCVAAGGFRSAAVDAEDGGSGDADETARRHTDSSHEDVRSSPPGSRAGLYPLGLVDRYCYCVVMCVDGMLKKMPKVHTEKPKLKPEHKLTGSSSPVELLIRVC